MPPLFRRCGGTFPQGKVRERPRRRKPSPPGKVDRAQPGPDEGKQPKSEKQATLNGSVFHSMVPVSLLGCDPSSVRAFGPATFPVGEGDLRRGLGMAGALLDWRVFPPHPSGLTPCHLPRGGRRPPAGAAYRRGRSLTFPWGKVAASAAGRGAVPGRTPVPPHTRHACGVPPSPRRGFKLGL